MKRTHHVDLRGFEVNLLRFREGGAGRRRPRGGWRDSNTPGPRWGPGVFLTAVDYSATPTYSAASFAVSPDA